MTPLNNAPTLSPASALSIYLWKVSIPVTVVGVCFLLIPTKCTSSFIFNIPYSMVPVQTVPLPAIFNEESIDIKNGLSVCLSGTSKVLSIAFNNFSMASAPICGSVPFKAHSADPLTNSVLSPSYSYYESNSLTSISTSSCISSSSTTSHLLRNTIIFLTPTYLHKRICSLVYGIAPSVADTTKIPPSILAAPVIIFLT